MTIWTNLPEDVRGYFVNLLAWLTQIILCFLLVRVWRLVATRRWIGADLVNPLLNDRRNLTLAILLTAITFPLIAGSIVEELHLHQAVLFSGSVLIALTYTLYELSTFWRTGLTHAEQGVAKNTYASALSSVSRSFDILGANAFNYCMLSTLKTAMETVRGGAGHLTFVLAHPDSPALEQASIMMSARKDLYSDQAWFAIGHIQELARQMAAPVVIELYTAATIDDLPIFRSMFVDGQRSVSSVAVYGRSDGGAAMPQIYASCRSRDSQAMYNVLWRYYRDFRRRASPLSSADETKASALLASVRSSNRDLSK